MCRASRFLGSAAMGVACTKRLPMVGTSSPSAALSNSGA